MRSTFFRSAAFFAFVVLTGLGGAYAVSSEADALDLRSSPATSAFQVTGAITTADDQIVQDDLRKLARQAMNDLIESGRKRLD